MREKYLRVILSLALAFSCLLSCFAASTAVYAADGALKLSGLEVENFRSVVKAQSELKKVTRRSQWKNHETPKKGYTMYDRFMVCRLGDQNALVLYTDGVIDDGCSYCCAFEIYWMEKDKLCSGRVFNDKLWLKGYSEKDKSLVMDGSATTGSYHCQLTIKNGKLVDRYYSTYADALPVSFNGKPVSGNAAKQVVKKYYSDIHQQKSLKISASNAKRINGTMAAMYAAKVSKFGNDLSEYRNAAMNFCVFSMDVEAGAMRGRDACKKTCAAYPLSVADRYGILFEDYFRACERAAATDDELYEIQYEFTDAGVYKLTDKELRVYEERVRQIDKSILVENGYWIVIKLEARVYDPYGDDYISETVDAMWLTLNCDNRIGLWGCASAEDGPNVDPSDVLWLNSMLGMY